MKDGAVQGFVVVGTVKVRGVETGVIKEILADPDDKETIALLFSSAVRFLKQRRVSAILCMMTDERFAGILKKFIFIRRANHEPMFIGNLEKAGVHRDLVSDIRNWHLTFGESDLFMFGRDRSPGPINAEGGDEVNSRGQRGNGFLADGLQPGTRESFPGNN
jgi:hypothetical protein